MKKVLELIMASVVPPRSSVTSVTSSVNVTNSGRPSFSEQISALGARISRAISRDGSGSQATTHGTETSASTGTHVGVGDAASADGLEKLRGFPQASDADTCELFIQALKFTSILPSFLFSSVCSRRCCLDSSTVSSLCFAP